MESERLNYRSGLRRSLVTGASPCSTLSFPGKEHGTLGKLVYDLHHDSHSHGVDRITPLSMQLMHIAAHIDAIKFTIVPALRSGVSVVLDRFWWSTKVYGLASGLSQSVLNQMIRIEVDAWEEFLPSTIFLIRRKEPLRQESKQAWERWRDLYADLALEEKFAPVVVVDNDQSVQEAMSLLIPAIDGSIRLQSQIETDSQMTLHLTSKKVLKLGAVGTTVLSALSPAVPTVAYDTYWRFAAERQEIFFRRPQGQACRLGQRTAYSRNSNLQTRIEHRTARQPIPDKGGHVCG